MKVKHNPENITLELPTHWAMFFYLVLKYTSAPDEFANEFDTIFNELAMQLEKTSVDQFSDHPMQMNVEDGSYRISFQDGVVRLRGV